jgi:hypothetical protein
MTNDETDQVRPQIHPLAYDALGDPIHLPVHAIGWRVRKAPKGAGRPKTIFDPETGRQLEIRIEATLAELAEQVTEAGRYRLEATDANGHLIPGYVAFTEVMLAEEEEQPASNPNNAGFSEMLTLVKHLVDTNSRVMEAMASAFGQVRPQRISAPVEIAPPMRNDTQGQNPFDTFGSVADIVSKVLAAVPNAKPPVAQNE